MEKNIKGLVITLFIKIIFSIIILIPCTVLSVNTIRQRKITKVREGAAHRVARDHVCRPSMRSSFYPSLNEVLYEEEEEDLKIEKEKEAPRIPFSFRFISQDDQNM